MALSIKIVELQGGRLKCNFWHPVLKCSVSYGFGKDRVRAENDCREAVEIFQSPALLADPESPRLMGYSVKAYEMVFGRVPSWADKVDDAGLPDHALIEDDDVARLATRMARVCGRVDLASTFAGMMSRIESRRYRE